MTSFAVKLDENLGRSHVDLLRQAGYTADRLYDEGLSGAKDDVVWQRVSAESRFFITLDLDFSDLRRFTPGTHPGILLLRPRAHGRQAVLDVLSHVLGDHPLQTLAGCLAVADETHTRVRRPAIRADRDDVASGGPTH
jgi:predicted nuclease of predicted toxin-antitoxin system